MLEYSSIKFSPKIDGYKDDIEISIKSYLENIGKTDAFMSVNCGSKCFYANFRTNPNNPKGLNQDQILELGTYLSEIFNDIFDDIDIVPGE